MASKKEIKLFVSHHKDGKVIESATILSVQVGAAINKVSLNMLKDNEGINISHKNDKYCELTAQYWAWKNVDADYYGFMHYRRHFVFNEIPETPDDGGLLHFLTIDDGYINKTGLNDEQISRIVDGWDIILPPMIDLSGWCAPSNEIQFSCLPNLHAKDFDSVCETVLELYPEYSAAVDKFRKGHDVYWYNMFIMRKEIFFDYSEWLFRILEAAEKKITFSEYDAQEKRTLAFMAERLLTIYIFNRMERKPETKLKHLKITFLHNTDVLPERVSEKTQEAEQVQGYLDWLCGSLEKSCRELYAINRLSAVNEGCAFEKSAKMRDYLNNSRLILYGAGNYGKRIKDILEMMDIRSPIEIWDAAAMEGWKLQGADVIVPEFGGTDYTDKICIVSIADKVISETIKERFLKDGAHCVMLKDEFMKIAINCIWHEICGRIR